MKGLIFPILGEENYNMYNLKKANKDAIKHACKYFHYSKSVPVNVFGYNVYFNNEWCGVILFGTGANNHIGEPYGLAQGEAIELVRIAMNGKQKEVTKPLAIALKLIKKDCPAVKLIVSYADVDQNHKGVIYQASNWIYEGLFNVGTVSGYMIKGKKVHNKSIYGFGVKQNLESVQKELDPNATKYVTQGKHKYLYPIDKSMVQLCKDLAKPYPKSDISVSVAQVLSKNQEAVQL